MVMTADSSVETGLAAGKIQLLDLAQPGEQFQIAIDSAQADVGQPAADNCVQRGGRRVGMELLEFPQNHLPLSAYYVECGFRSSRDLSLSVIITD